MAEMRVFGKKIADRYMNKIDSSVKNGVLQPTPMPGNAQHDIDKILVLLSQIPDLRTRLRIGDAASDRAADIIEANLPAVRIMGEEFMRRLLKGNNPATITGTELIGFLEGVKRGVNLFDGGRPLADHPLFSLQRQGPGVFPILEGQEGIKSLRQGSGKGE